MQTTKKTTAEKIKTSVEKIGARATARRLVDLRIQSLTGISIDDMPDTSELADIFDELETIVSASELNEESLREVLSQINIDFLEDQIFS